MSEKEKDELFENAAESELIDENLDDVSGGAGALKFPQAKCTCPILFFASTFWTKLQNIFGHCCMSKLDKVAKRWPVVLRLAI